MKTAGPLVFACLALVGTVAAAQSTNYTSVDVPAGTATRIGYYGFAKKDCTPEPLPSVDVVAPPKHGVLTVRSATLNTNTLANCPNLKLPAQVVLYRSQPGYVGADQVVYGVKNQSGEVNVYSISITVKEGATPQAPSNNL